MALNTWSLLIKMPVLSLCDSRETWIIFHICQTGGRSGYLYLTGGLSAHAKDLGLLCFLEPHLSSANVRECRDQQEGAGLSQVMLKSCKKPTTSLVRAVPIALGKPVCWFTVLSLGSALLDRGSSAGR